MNMRGVPVSRNQPLGFAERTRKNLVAIEAAADKGLDVHVVTQVAMSLLGLVAFLWEKRLVDRVATLKLNDLVEDGWPSWVISLGRTETLGELAQAIRNAVAHDHLTFSSDSRALDEVSITLRDRKPKKEYHWCATMRADQVREFCLRFIDLINKTEKPKDSTAG